MSFQDKVVLITGATGGLGRSVTHSFLEEQASVVVTYRDDAELAALKTSAPVGGTELMASKTNVLDSTSVEALVADTINKHQRIDALVHLVGGFFMGGSSWETPEDKWDLMMDMNIKSTFLCCKHVLPHMVRQGSGAVVTIGARPGLLGGAGMAAYAASKAALTNFTQSLAQEVLQHNITANVIVPSIIDTPANRQAMPDADFESWVSGEDLANAIKFAASGSNKAISGAVIPVYGKV